MNYRNANLQFSILGKMDIKAYNFEIVDFLDFYAPFRVCKTPLIQ